MSAYYLGPVLTPPYDTLPQLFLPKENTTKILTIPIKDQACINQNNDLPILKHQLHANKQADGAENHKSHALQRPEQLREKEADSVCAYDEAHQVGRHHH